jgi:hypothetical protein
VTAPVQLKLSSAKDESLNVVVERLRQRYEVEVPNVTRVATYDGGEVNAYASLLGFGSADEPDRNVWPYPPRMNGNGIEMLPRIPERDNETVSLRLLHDEIAPIKDVFDNLSALGLEVRFHSRISAKPYTGGSNWMMLLQVRPRDTKAKGEVVPSLLDYERAKELPDGAYKRLLADRSARFEVFCFVCEEYKPNFDRWLGLANCFWKKGRVSFYPVADSPDKVQIIVTPSAGQESVKQVVDLASIEF